MPRPRAGKCSVAYGGVRTALEVLVPLAACGTADASRCRWSDAGCTGIVARRVGMHMGMDTLCVAVIRKSGCSVKEAHYVVGAEGTGSRSDYGDAG